MTTAWSRAHLEILVEDRSIETPVLSLEETARMLPDLYLWDLWPVRLPDGGLARVDGAEMWMALSASSLLDPGARHDAARIRLISLVDGQWADLGQLFPEGASPGSREWAGCATLDPDTGTVDVYYTASGRAGESRPSFVQRIVHAPGRLVERGTGFGEWKAHHDAVTPGGRYQSTASQDTGEPGFIKAFRDPFRFTDPRDGIEYLLFTASLAGSGSDFDGAIGVATRPGAGRWSLLPPLVHADGVNNELERPHVVVRDGLYYVFFSTQARTFHPEVEGPTGLYGFVGDGILGPFEPLNGSGLVLRNPVEEPYQAYSWLVLNDLRVTSFVDFHSLGGRKPEEVEGAGEGPAHFGGTMAPIESISVDGATARLRPRK
jgi:levansucrase